MCVQIHVAKVKGRLQKCKENSTSNYENAQVFVINHGTESLWFGYEWEKLGSTRKLEFDLMERRAAGADPSWKTSVPL